MSPASLENVVIIGGGLTVSQLLVIYATCAQTHITYKLQGLSLALALHKFCINCSIYELRLPDIETPGCLMLSPNALRILDVLGVYPRIREKGYSFEDLAFKDSKKETTHTYRLGNEKQYGYKGLRICRNALLAELRFHVVEAKISITYEKEFSHVISEDIQQGVTFAFTDGSVGNASLLIGADGLYSTVREHITSLKPSYTGQLAVTGLLPVTDLDFTSNNNFELPVYIFATPGQFVMTPQTIDGGEILVGAQFPYLEQDRAGWDVLSTAKPTLLRLLRKDMQDWPHTVQSALRHVRQDSLTIWPCYTVPKSNSWASPDERVIILGDAAHALPPSAGQRVSQVFEDGFTLAAFLSKNLLEQKGALEAWQKMRQGRIDRVIELTRQLNNARLPEEEREKHYKEAVWQDGHDGSLGWLYNARVEEHLLD